MVDILKLLTACRRFFRFHSIINDYLGTPKEAYDKYGDSVWKCEHEAYGKVKSCEGEVGVIPFRFQGQYHDVETGLYYNRFRYYAPDEAMYVSQDPIRIWGGMNVFSYVSDPNCLIDQFAHKDCFANDQATKWAEEIIGKHGGFKLKDGHYQMPNRRAARQAASEIAGNLGNNPIRVTKGDFRGGPRTWKDNPTKIGQYSQDKSSGWRDDVLGHDFGSDKIGSHVNAWNNEKGVFDNLHLLY
ncbi:RHS repeat-associated core domain-containing protein [Cytophagaceae bacterium ABcell3]|nr:RHS repeat-associated core domain-containing protein [Cytophagaceae bacterium ABcell3]